MALALFAGSFAILLALGMPIGFVFLVPSVLYMLATDVPLVLAGQTMLQQFLKFVLLAIPQNMLQGHVKTLAGIARLLNDEDLRQQLMTAASAAEAFAAIKASEAES